MMYDTDTASLYFLVCLAYPLTQALDGMGVVAGGCGMYSSVSSFRLFTLLTCGVLAIP